VARCKWRTHRRRVVIRRNGADGEPEEARLARGVASLSLNPTGFEITSDMQRENTTRRYTRPAFHLGRRSRSFCRWLESNLRAAALSREGCLLPGYFLPAADRERERERGGEHITSFLRVLCVLSLSLSLSFLSFFSLCLVPSLLLRVEMPDDDQTAAEKPVSPMAVDKAYRLLLKSGTLIATNVSLGRSGKAR